MVSCTCHSKAPNIFFYVCSFSVCLVLYLRSMWLCVSERSVYIFNEAVKLFQTPCLPQRLQLILIIEVNKIMVFVWTCVSFHFHFLFRSVSSTILQCACNTLSTHPSHHNELIFGSFYCIVFIYLYVFLLKINKWIVKQRTLDVVTIDLVMHSQCIRFTSK